MLPDGIFEGLTSLTTLRLQNNAVNPLPLTVSLEKVANGQFKAVAPSGAPFDIVLPLTVANGSITGGATTLTIPAGNVESDTLTVTRTPGTIWSVTVDIRTLPSLPPNHSGYSLVKSADLPLEVIEGYASGPEIWSGNYHSRHMGKCLRKTAMRPATVMINVIMPDQLQTQLLPIGARHTQSKVSDLQKLVTIQLINMY